MSSKDRYRRKDRKRGKSEKTRDRSADAMVDNEGPSLRQLNSYYIYIYIYIYIGFQCLSCINLI